MKLLQDLRRIDLEQKEHIQKLHIRLTNELGIYHQLLEAIAVKESEIDQLRTGVKHPREQRSKDDELAILEAELDHMEDSQIRVLLTLKSSVWAASNTLKQLHDQRNVAKASVEQQAELEEELEEV
jgi:hypothetical protein